MVPVLNIKRLDGFDPDVALPQYETAGAAGADIRANFPVGDREGLSLKPGARALVPTGLAVEVPQGYEMQIRPRSGLALKHGVTLANTPGTIDADYRGPVGVILINLGAHDVRIAHGERIAQIVIAPVVQAVIAETQDLSETARGVGGFGSTGRD